MMINESPQEVIGLLLPHAVNDNDGLTHVTGHTSRLAS
jgi:hypothetical protein